MLDPLTLDDLMGYGAPPNPQAARVNALRGTPQASPVGRPRVQATSTPTRVQTQAPAPATPAPAGVSPVEGRAAERQRLTAAMDALSGPQDYSAQKAEAIDRSRQSGNALLLSLAAKAAGEDFADAGGMHLKQAMALRDPLKVEGGHVNAQGEVVIDPRFQAQQELARLQRRIGELDKLDAADLDRQQRAELAREKMQADAQHRQLMAAIAQGGLDLRRDALEARRGQEQKLAANVRTQMAEADGMEASLGQAITALQNSSGQGTGYFQGLVQEKLPGGETLVSKTRDEGTRAAIQQLTYVTDAIRHGRFGSALTATEKASAAQYLPSPYDSRERLIEKAQGLQDLVRLNNQKMRIEFGRAGAEGFGPNGERAPAAPGAAAPAAPVSGVPARVQSYYN